jgi:hypothetical protein
MPASAGLLLDDLTPGDIDVVRLLDQADGALERLSELGTGWLSGSLIHGDIRPENWFFRKGSCGGPEVELGMVDWESADLGDPAWDVGAVLHEPIAAAVLSAESVGRHGSAAVVEDHLDSFQPVIEEFWNAYGDSMALAPGVTVPTLERCMGFAGAWLVQTAIEHAAVDRGVRPGVAALVYGAIDIWRRPVEAAHQLLGLS